MRQSRFTAEQIIAILAEQERGMRTAEVCRNHGISPNTFYKRDSPSTAADISPTRASSRAWRLLHGGLKRLLADTMLDNVVLKRSAGNELTLS